MGGRRAIFLATALATAALVAAGCSSSGSGSSSPGTSAATTASQSVSSLTKIRIATNNANGQLPVQVALKEGIFKKHGLDATVTVVPNIIVIPPALGKTYDLGYTAGPILITAVANGLPIEAVVGNEVETSDPTTQITHLLAAKDIKDIKQLKGKAIGAATLTGTLNLATKGKLAVAGVDPASVRYVQVNTPVMLDQLRAGRVAAVELQQPYLGVGIKEGFTDLGDLVGPAMGYPTVMTYYLATKSWVSGHASAVQAFREALTEAMQWIKQNPDQARAMLAKLTGITVEQAKSIGLGGFSTDISGPAVKKWGDLMEKYAGFDKQVDYDAMVAK